ncbi:DEAD/DEAH box helicase [Dermabacteraceae bacterium P7054]
MQDRNPLLRMLTAPPQRRGCLRHVENVPARSARYADISEWVTPGLRRALYARGVERLWSHQAQAAELAHAGRDVVIATGTASGKSLGYLLPLLSALQEGGRDVSGRAPSAIYLSPSKALAADQYAAMSELIAAGELGGVRARIYDGDTPSEERRWARKHANLLLTNPDMLHHALLPGHEQATRFWRGLKYVVIDECHSYRGVFGAHVSLVLRRLRRIAARYGAEPTFILASATSADPALSASRLIGREVAAITEDGSPRGGLTFALWDPVDPEDETKRRPSGAESAALLADLVAAGAQTLAFTRSRRAAEMVAQTASRLLRERAEESASAPLLALAERVSAYRGGYLPSERRELEAALRAGEIRGMASTNALELGIDISSLDAVIVNGWPGTRASLWQQVGRAGRGAQEDALAIFVAREDPLDSYVVSHPETVFAAPVEAAVFDPANPYVLMPHLCAAAAELPISPAEVAEVAGENGAESVRLGVWPENTAQVLRLLGEKGTLRKRPHGWFWTHAQSAHALTDLRGSGGQPVRIIETGTGQMLGTVDAGSAHEQVHDGAVYLHRGRTFVIDHLDVKNAVAFAHRDNPLVSTHPQNVSEIRVIGVEETVELGGGVRRCYGSVEVRDRVTGYQVRDVYTQAVLGQNPLDLPERTLRSKAVWWVLPERTACAGIDAEALPGALHAAEHALISLLPLVATCDRWDIGGVSTALHPDTGHPTIFVYDGAAGGAGFSQRGHREAAAWWRATTELLTHCPCAAGCPACVVSPKCGNGNEPLSKPGALTLLSAGPEFADRPGPDVPGSDAPGAAGPARADDSASAQPRE